MFSRTRRPPRQMVDELNAQLPVIAGLQGNAGSPMSHLSVKDESD